MMMRSLTAVEKRVVTKAEQDRVRRCTLFTLSHS